jgi:hypothetical protein
LPPFGFFNIHCHVIGKALARGIYEGGDCLLAIMQRNFRRQFPAAWRYLYVGNGYSDLCPGGIGTMKRGE